MASFECDVQTKSRHFKHVVFTLFDFKLFIWWMYRTSSLRLFIFFFSFLSKSSLYELKNINQNHEPFKVAAQL